MRTSSLALLLLSVAALSQEREPLLHADEEGLERISTDPSFDGFPMFSPDGRRLVFASKRGAAVRGETNLFIADWVD